MSGFHGFKLERRELFCVKNSIYEDFNWTGERNSELKTSYVRLKLAIDDSWEVCETRKTYEMRETREEKGRTQDNPKIHYTCFALRLFCCTIKFYPLSHEKISFVSCVITSFTTRWFETRDTRNLSHKAAYEKTSNVSNYAFFTLLCEWVDIGQTHGMD